MTVRVAATPRAVIIVFEFMANRRMFSKEVTNSSDFQMMSPSAQSLYFHIGMNSDDDGFCEVFTIVRMTESKPDDLRALHERGLVYIIDSRVCIVKDWHANNDIRPDRYTRSRYLDDPKYGEIYKTIMHEKIEHLSRYKVLLPNGTTDGTTQVRLGKDRKGKDKTRAQSAGDREGFTTLGAELLRAFEVVDAKNKTYYANRTQRAAADFLIKEYGLEEVKRRVEFLPTSNKLPYFPRICTPHDLKEKWTSLQDAVERYKNDKKLKKPLVI